MTLQMHYQEKYEQGLEQGAEQEKEKTVRRLIELGKFSFEEIATITELSVEKIKEIANLQLI